MVKYKCGHETDGAIILDSNKLSMAGYLDWADSVGINGTKEMCFDCYCSPKSRKEKSK